MFEYFASLSMRRNLRRASMPALLTTAMLAAFTAAAQSSGPSQLPLITRAGAQVKANMMVTVDDSGSMTWSYMPEGVITINSKQVGMPNGKYVSDVLDEPVVTYSEQFQEISTAPAIPASQQSKYTTYLSQRYLRSPQVNTLYYDPTVRYDPWLKADKSRYPAASYTAAVCDPNNIVTCPPGIDLSKTVNMTPNTRYGTSGGKPKLYPSSWISVMSTDGAGNSTWGTDGKSTLPFDPALYYILTPGADPNVAGSYKEYDLNDPKVVLPPKDPNRTDCAAAVCSLTEEHQNFANWFVYYRTRNLMAKGALSEALPNGIKLIRLGWGSINFGGVIRSKMTDLTDYTKLDPILTGIQNFKAGNSTPLRTALDSVGQYFQKSDSDSPWLDTLGDSKSLAAACRRSYSILTTDGYYNDTYKLSSVDSVAGGADGVAGRKNSVAADNPLGAAITNYQPVAPFSDKQDSMLADVASYYYVNDLQPKIENKVPPQLVDSSDPKGPAYPAGGKWQSDIAYWQHLQQFTVGLGVKGTLDANPTLPDGKTPNPNYSLAKLLDKTESYVDSSGKTVMGTGPIAWSNDHIDDLWHAALNTHGQYFSVHNSKELASALISVINQASANPTGQAGAVASTTQMQTDTLAYVPKYVYGAWTGDLYAYHLDTITGKPTTVAWQATKAGLVPTYDKRNSWTLAKDGATGVPFTWGGMGSDNQALVSAGSQSIFGVPGSDALINYFKGDGSNEGASGLYRTRVRADAKDSTSTTLPDYVDSPPLLVKNFVDAKYGSMTCGGVTYDAYVTGVKDARSTGTIFIGGNGGMLNAFDSTTGKELFDYVPRSGLQKLATVAYKGYGSDAFPHQFFVDGPLLESDACIVNKNSGGKVAWTNLVVGALGAGGSGVFVLDTTSVGTASAHFDATMPLREWSGVTDDDIGDIFSNPQIASIKGGGWKVITGNGVYSKNGAAYLLVLDLSTGTIEKVHLGSDVNTGAMGVQLVYDGDRQAIGAYVGDIKGNMWRVEFRGPTQKSWKVGNGTNPLFTATGPGGVPQPITAVPALVPNETGGNTVLFGTGKLYDTTDPDDKNVQTTYGVVDSTPITQDILLTKTFTRADLNVQAVTAVNSAVAVDKSVGYYYTVSKQGTTTSPNGWLMDLVFTGGTPQIAPGTRVIYPEAVFDTAVFVNAVTPAAIPAECNTASGNGYFFVLDTTTGGQPSDPTWDTNGDGVFDDKDITGAGVATSAGGTATQVYKDGNASDGIYAINSDEGHLWRPPSVKCTINCKVTDRVWRQILTPPTP